MTAGKTLTGPELLSLLSNNKEAIAKLLAEAPPCEAPIEDPAPPSPEAALAADLRGRLTAALGPVLALINEARGTGFEIAFGIARDANGQEVLRELKITRNY